MSASHEMFVISRADGRSNQQVVIDLVKDDEPGTIRTYEEFIAALSEGTAQRYDANAVKSIVNQSAHRMLVESKRALVNVRGVGYKVAHGAEHLEIAGVRQRRSESQINKAVALLKNVRRDELNDSQWTVFQSTLMIMSAVADQVQGLRRRQDRYEKALDALRNQIAGQAG